MAFPSGASPGHTWYAMDDGDSNPGQRIELLSPAGDWECALAAIENGADAIYFGLARGFNARHRAKNFDIEDLPELGQLLRSRGVRGYVTLNTLVFPSELTAVAHHIEQIAESGIDAVLVQDFGVAQLVRSICPELEIHASTQMSLTSAETIVVAASLGLSRVVLARELSVAEIGKISAQTDMPLEVFIHGALCVAYSGQCLTSESLGGRSANRGQCAQACRLPYELVCDGEDRDLGEVRYLLSPQDLAGYAAIPALIEAGVASVKIEGRLKTPEYVANITSHYRRSIEQAYRAGRVMLSDQDRREMELSFSRGFTPGWLEGNDHKRLVPGLDSAKRGIEIGRVAAIESQRIQVRLAAPIALGDGLAIDGGTGLAKQGGRIYSLRTRNNQPLKSASADQRIWIGFGRGEIKWDQVSEGARVSKNDDPKLNRRLRRSFNAADPQTHRSLDLQVVARVHSPVKICAALENGLQIEVIGDEPLAVANKHPITIEVLRDKLGRLGNTPFQLRNLDAHLEGGPMVPIGTLNRLRRKLTTELLQQLQLPPRRRIDRNAAQRLLALDQRVAGDQMQRPLLAVLCRNLEQLRVVCEMADVVDQIYADFHDIRQYDEAVRTARSCQIPIGLATVRMQKPGEMGLLKAIAKRQPDLVVARNLAAIEFFRDSGSTVIADFSLNVANQLSARWLRSLGVERVTASYDLNRDQLADLTGSSVAPSLEVVIHQHMPMFHMEHCVFCAVLSPGTNKTNCGRPCDRHLVQLRDRVGAEHRLEADVACRNTLYNATPQSGAEVVGELLSSGVRAYRVELLDENGRQAQTAITTYRQLLAGAISGEQVWQRLQATNRVGVTRGTLESKRNPLAVL